MQPPSFGGCFKAIVFVALVLVWLPMCENSERKTSAACSKSGPLKGRLKPFASSEGSKNDSLCRSATGSPFADCFGVAGTCKIAPLSKNFEGLDVASVYLASAMGGDMPLRCSTCISGVVCTGPCSIWCVAQIRVKRFGLGFSRASWSAEMD